MNDFKLFDTITPSEIKFLEFSPIMRFPYYLMKKKSKDYLFYFILKFNDNQMFSTKKEEAIIVGKVVVRECKQKEEIRDLTIKDETEIPLTFFFDEVYPRCTVPKLHYKPYVVEELEIVQSLTFGQFDLGYVLRKIADDTKKCIILKPDLFNNDENFFNRCFNDNDTIFNNVIIDESKNKGVLINELIVNPYVRCNPEKSETLSNGKLCSTSPLKKIKGEGKNLIFDDIVGCSLSDYFVSSHIYIDDFFEGMNNFFIIENGFFPTIGGEKRFLVVDNNVSELEVLAIIEYDEKSKTISRMNIDGLKKYSISPNKIISIIEKKL